MSYNQHHFTAEILDVLRREVDFTIESQDEVLQVLMNFLLAANGLIQLEHHEAFLNLFAKIRINLGSCQQLLPQLREDYRFKASVNLLYRSILDDLINLYYLYGFLVQDAEDQTSLANELNVLHLEFLKSAEIIFRSESYFKKYLHQLFSGEASALYDSNQAITELKSANRDLYDKVLDRWKTTPEIRSSSSTLFTARLPKGNGFISESKKIDFIISGGFSRGEGLRYLFKYFSQYQHFSPWMHTAMLAAHDYDVICYQVTLTEIICALSNFLPILNLTHKEDMNQRLHKLLERIITKRDPGPHEQYRD